MHEIPSFSASSLSKKAIEMSSLVRIDRGPEPRGNNAGAIDKTQNWQTTQGNGFDGYKILL